MIQDPHNEKFSIYEIVWAKLKGHSWWPAVVFENKEKGCVVSFLGEKSHAFIPEINLLKWKENFDYLCIKAKRNRKLKFAIEIANKILDKQLLFEDHEKYIDEFWSQGEGNNKKPIKQKHKIGILGDKESHPRDKFLKKKKIRWLSKSSEKIDKKEEEYSELHRLDSKKHAERLKVLDKEIDQRQVR